MCVKRRHTGVTFECCCFRCCPFSAAVDISIGSVVLHLAAGILCAPTSSYRHCTQRPKTQKKITVNRYFQAEGIKISLSWRMYSNDFRVGDFRHFRRGTRGVFRHKTCSFLCWCAPATSGGPRHNLGIGETHRLCVAISLPSYVNTFIMSLVARPLFRVTKVRSQARSNVLGFSLDLLLSTWMSCIHTRTTF